MKHRLQLARRNAGLSIGQSSQLSGIPVAELTRMEAMDGPVIVHAKKLAELYGVSVPYLVGDSPSHDYATIDAMNGADKLTSRDREILAEFAASIPRKDTP